jgi:hypothetical protein
MRYYVYLMESEDEGGLDIGHFDERNERLPAVVNDGVRNFWPWPMLMRDRLFSGDRRLPKFNGTVGVTEWRTVYRLGAGLGLSMFPGALMGPVCLDAGFTGERVGRSMIELHYGLFVIRREMVEAISGLADYVVGDGFGDWLVVSPGYAWGDEKCMQVYFDEDNLLNGKRVLGDKFKSMQGDMMRWGSERKAPILANPGLLGTLFSEEAVIALVGRGGVAADSFERIE